MHFISYFQLRDTKRLSRERERHKECERCYQGICPLSMSIVNVIVTILSLLRFDHFWHSYVNIKEIPSLAWQCIIFSQTVSFFICQPEIIYHCLTCFCWISVSRRTLNFWRYDIAVDIGFELWDKDMLDLKTKSSFCSLQKYMLVWNSVDLTS